MMYATILSVRMGEGYHGETLYYLLRAASHRPSLRTNSANSSAILFEFLKSQIRQIHCSSLEGLAGGRTILKRHRPCKRVYVFRFESLHILVSPQTFLLQHEASTGLFLILRGPNRRETAHCDIKIHLQNRQIFSKLVAAWFLLSMAIRNSRNESSLLLFQLHLNKQNPF